MDHLHSWLLTQVAAHAHRLVAEGMGAVGARGYHYRLLSSLIEEGPASQAALGRRTNIHLSDLVGALNELEDGGFITRNTDISDRRRNVITVTPKGRDRADELAERAKTVQDDLLGPLSQEERDILAGLLRRLLDHHAPAAAHRPGRRGDAAGS
ncbi:MarR family transcriptional regulator [Actinoplanes sp. NPDC051861]|uniref:MarR family winged helix-turn-helix transcriptional regulator n=1 Tax=Actinoplanes sp. NPDC051861 TaxID=3155170 RepID=UPI00341DB07C